jgi:hypothetical protein
MRLTRTTRLTAGTVGAWVALGLALAAVAAGLPAPARAIPLLAGAACALSVTEGIRTALAAWRGPVITSFPRVDAVLCDPRCADTIRGGAQLRGTMGGAGYVFRARLAFPAIAWGAAAAIAAALVRAPSLRVVPGATVAVLACAIAASLLAPARPFFYREVTGGRLLVFPPGACAELLAGGPARASGERAAAAGADAGWVSSRTPLEPRGNSPRPDPARHP